MSAGRPDQGSSIDRFRAMGTDVDVRIVPRNDADRSELHRLARHRIADLEHRWSRFLSDSELSRLNASGGKPCLVSAETARLLSLARSAWVLTDGWFDPTIGAGLIRAGYDRPFDQLTAGSITTASTNPARTTTPTLMVSRSVSDEIEAAPGFDGATLTDPGHHPRTDLVDEPDVLVQLPPEVTVDLGGIAKGHSADLVAAELLGCGAEAVLVNIGGDLRVDGVPPDDGWAIDLECRGTDRCHHLTVRLNRGAVCTSTTRKRRWSGAGGRTEHHLRNPSTGAATDTDITTATIIAATAAQAEVLATWAVATGASATIDRHRSDNVTGVLVGVDDDLYRLEGLERFLPAARAGV